MLNPLKKIKHLQKTPSLVFLLFLICFLLLSCSHESKNQQDLRYEEFFTRLLFLEGAAYTIHGSKPITEIALDRRTEEERERDYKQYLESLTDDQKVIIENQVGVKWSPQYDFGETWDMWEESLDKQQMKKYLLVHIPRGIQKLDFVYLVNIIETAKVIQTNYDLFQKYVGLEFDPLTVVLEIGEQTSIFWQKLFQKETSSEQACLWGILFGYGLENSYPFSWFYSKKDGSKKSKFSAQLFNTMIHEEKPMDFTKLSSQDFPLPGFISFSDPDPILLKYQKEREKIKRCYKGHNLKDVVEQELNQI